MTKRAKILWIAGLVFSVGLIGQLISGPPPSRRQESAPAAEQTPQAEARRLSVDASLGDRQLTFKNKDAFDWTNVVLRVSPQTGLFVDWYEYKSDRVIAGQAYHVGLAQFTDSDGKRFDPFSYRPRQVFIRGDTPSGSGIWGGERE